MAIYYPPPQPFIGGRQPLDPGRKAPIPVATVGNDPLFGYPSDIFPEVYTIIRMAWEPPPPMPPVAGWLSPGIPGQSIDQPLPNARGDLWIPARLWQPPDPQPQRSGNLSSGLPGQSVDNPSFGYPTLVSPETFLLIQAAWAPSLLLPAQRGPMAPGIPGQSVDPPLFGVPTRTFPTLFGPIRPAWEPGPPTPVQRGPLVAGVPGQSVDNPGFACPTILLPNTFALIRAAWGMVVQPGGGSGGISGSLGPMFLSAAEYLFTHRIRRKDRRKA